MTIFEFADFKEYLRYLIHQKIVDKNGRKKSNITRVAKDLGYASPSLLSMVVNGRRLPSDEFCESISRSWKLSLKESEYLRLLVELERRRAKGEDNQETLERIRRLVGKRVIHKFQDSEFSMIREWHFVVILQLAQSAQFQEDPQWISRALRKKVTPSQAQQAFGQLVEMRALVRHPETGKWMANPVSRETTHEVSSASIRLHHAQMLQKAAEALEERPVEERFFNSLTLSFDPQRLAEVKTRLLEFMRSLDTDFNCDGASAVAQINLQLFEHTSEFGKPTIFRRGSHGTH